MGGLTEVQESLLGGDEAYVSLMLALASAAASKATKAKETADANRARAEAVKARKKAAAEQALAGKNKAVGRKEIPDAAVEVGMEVNMSSLASASNFSPAPSAGRFFVTTAINYTNGNPHIGHAYEAITADILSRYHRMYGREVFFQTGTDEHGQKIANTAEREALQPIDICNKYAEAFQALNRQLLIGNDCYLRTTNANHHKVAQDLWSKCAESGDIYLGRYEGWYDEREETFISDKDAELADFKDGYGTPLKRMAEESYFFRMGKYQQWLVKYIEDHPDFILPADKRNNILGRLVEPLPDLSISRTSFSWGIPVPEGFDSRHVMYVWFDALSNYLSGISAMDSGNPLSRFWPANVHIIGKDIIWFHCVIWPCMLQSAGVELPHHVFAHGFIAGADGRKMSKSLGNVVDPHDLLMKYSVDTVRWYMCRETPYGNDISFSLASLVNMHNSELCDTLGNLAHRTFNLNQKFSGSIVPEPLAGATYAPFDLNALRDEVEACMEQFSLQSAFGAVIAAVRDTNKFINDEAPWLLKGDEHANTRAEVVRVTLDALYVMAHLLAPVIPVAASELLRLCGQPPIAIKDLRPDFKNISAGTKTSVGRILYKKLDMPEEEGSEGVQNNVAACASEAPLAKGKAVEPSAAATKKDKKKKKPVADIVGPEQDHFTKIDIRVGRITKVWEHPEAERLFCEEIDCGEAEPRIVASGLREHYTLSEMEGRLLCVVCNLKPAKLAGFTSCGMVLAAKDDHGKVELIRPPEGSTIGERLTVNGLSGEPATASHVAKKKLWQALAPSLRVDSSGVACFQGNPITTTKGPCTTDLVKDAQIS